MTAFRALILVAVTIVCAIVAAFAAERRFDRLVDDCITSRNPAGEACSRVL